MGPTHVETDAILQGRGRSWSSRLQSAVTAGGRHGQRRRGKLCVIVNSLDMIFSSEHFEAKYDENNNFAFFFT